MACRFRGLQGGSPNQRPWSNSHDGFMSLRFRPMLFVSAVKVRVQLLLLIAPAPRHGRTTRYDVLHARGRFSTIRCSSQLSKIRLQPDIVIHLWLVRTVRSFSLWGGGNVILPWKLHGPSSHFVYGVFTVARPLGRGLVGLVEEGVAWRFCPSVSDVLLRRLSPL